MHINLQYTKIVFKVYFKTQVIENISLYGKSNANVLKLKQTHG